MDWAYKMLNLTFLIEIVSVSMLPQIPKNATDILGAHLNTSRATEMFLTFLESWCTIAKFSFPDRNCISLRIATIAQNVGDMYHALYVVEESKCVASLVDVRDKPFLHTLLLLLPLS